MPLGRFLALPDRLSAPGPVEDAWLDAVDREEAIVEHLLDRLQVAEDRGGRGYVMLGGRAGRVGLQGGEAIEQGGMRGVGRGLAVGQETVADRGEERFRQAGP